MKKFIIFMASIISLISLSNETINANTTITIPEVTEGNKKISIPLIPLEPAIKKKAVDIDKEKEEKRELEKTFSIYLDTQMDVFVPLEVMSDIDIKATVLANETVVAPFEINLNKKPDKKNYYSIKYSDTFFDIDGDGNFDTKIYSPKYINDRKETNNYIEIMGSKISKEGKHKKIVYLTVEVGGE